MRHTLVVVPAANMRYYLAVVVVGFWGSITETHLLPCRVMQDLFSDGIASFTGLWLGIPHSSVRIFAQESK